jgi:hypothetical protein
MPWISSPNNSTPTSFTTQLQANLFYRKHNSSTPVNSCFTRMHRGEHLILKPLSSIVQLQGLNAPEGTFIVPSGISPRCMPGVWRSNWQGSLCTWNSACRSRACLSSTRVMGIWLTINKCITAARNSSSPWWSTWPAQIIGVW